MKAPDFVRNLTRDAEMGLLQSALSREKEIEEITRILAAPEKPNCALIGPPGSGKSAIVEGLAQKIYVEKAFPFQIFLVDLAALNSGTIYRGMLEERAQALLAFGSSDRNIVLFIDEFHMLAGLGRAMESGASSDVSQILKPALARGTIRCIGATTEEEFSRYIQPDGAMVRRFQIVRVRSIEGEQLNAILRSKISDFETRLLIRLPPDTCDRVASAARQMFPDRADPDRSLDVLRRIVQKYQDRSSLRSAKSNSLQSTLGVLEEQKIRLKSRDLKGAASIAREWLGVGSLQSREISRNELEASLTEIASKVGP